MKRTIYRDSRSGRFVSKQTWTRSKSQGGSRYRRQRIKAPSAPEPPRKPLPTPVADIQTEEELEQEIEEAEDFEDVEFEGAFDSP